MRWKYKKGYNDALDDVYKLLNAEFHRWLDEGDLKRSSDLNRIIAKTDRWRRF